MAYGYWQKMDSLSPQQRHFCMSRIRGKNTKPEMIVRRWLWSQGFRYRINDHRFIGKPDLVLKKWKTVIFVNGCFWHGHAECGRFRLPKSNVQFWQDKISRNQQRDAANYLQYRLNGWQVIVVWECQLLPAVRQQTLQQLTAVLDKIVLSSSSVASASAELEKESSQYLEGEENLSIAAEESLGYNS